MAQDKPALIVSTSLNEVESKKQIQKSLNKIGKELKLDMGNLNTQKQVVEINKVTNSIKAQFKEREKNLQYEQKVRYEIEKQTKRQENAEKQVTAELEKQKEKLKLFQAEMERKSTKLTSGKFGSTVDTEVLSSLQSRVSGLSIESADDIKPVQKEMNRLNSEFKDVALNAQQARTGFVRFTDEATHSFKKFSEYMIIGSLFMGVVGAFQYGIQSIFDLDKALTELKKTTDATSEQINKLAKDSYVMADALAATNIQVIEAVTVFSKMGYALDSATKLGELAVKLQTVGDNMGSMEDTANSLVAILKGFGVDENSAVSVTAKRVDQLNAVSNEFAVSTSDLTNGMQRVSAAMAVGGNSFEQTTALLTAGTEVMQNWEIVARGLSTTSQRIFDQGADALRQFGIETTNANGTLRSTFDILTDLHDIYPSMTEEQQRWMLSTIAGKDQFKSLSSIMQNWGAVSKAMETQMNANGSATEELNRKLDSLEGRVNKMTNSFSKFWNGALNSSFVKGVITTITELTDTITILNGATQGLLVPTAILVGLMIKFKDIALVQTIASWTASLMGFSVAEGVVTGTTNVLGLSFKALQASLGVVGIAMLAIGFAFNKYQEHVQNAKQETEKFKSAQEELNSVLSKGDDTTKEKVKQLEMMIAKYDELTRKQKEQSSQQVVGKSMVSSTELEKTSSELSKLNVKFKELGTTAEEAKKKIQSGNEALENTRKQSKITSETMEHLSGRVTDMSDKYSMLKNAQEELNDQGYLSQTTIDAISEKYGKFIDVTKLSSTAIVDFVNTEKNAITQSIKNNIAETDAQIKTRQDKIKSIRTEIEALGLLAKAKGQSGVVAMYEQYAKGRSLEGVLKEMDALENKNVILKNSLKEIASIEKGDPNKDKKSSTKDKITLLTELEKKLADNNHQLNIQREKTSQLADTDERRVSSINEEIKLMGERQTLFNQSAIKARAEISAIKAKGKLTDEDKKRMEELQQSVREYGEEWTSLQTNIITSKNTIKDFYKTQQELDAKALKDAEDALDKRAEEINAYGKEQAELQKKQAEEHSKFEEDLYKDLVDALEKQDEERLRQLKRTKEKEIEVIENEIKALDQMYNEQEKTIEKDDLNKKILALEKEKNMRKLEGSLDANARIYEIDKELVDLKKQQSSIERKDAYEKDKAKLESAKSTKEKEIQAEEQALEERKQKQVYYAQAKALIEKQSMDEIVRLLSTYNEQFRLDGEIKGKSWADAFKTQLATIVFPTMPNQTSSGSTSTQTPSYSSGSSMNYEKNMTGATGVTESSGTSHIFENSVTAYATGGVNDFTGIAKLDGTKALPEVVLNPQQISNVASSLGMSGSPRVMAQGLYNYAKTGGGNSGGGSNIVINNTINGTFKSNEDMTSFSKTLAKTMEKQLFRSGTRF